jgi:peptidoglycan/LPS O-acetylase OafA/YrhL
MTITAAPQRIYFKNLDFLRFLAAYMIILLHSYFGWKEHFTASPFANFLSASALAKVELVTHNFSFGVDIFFIISGFLLTYLLLAEHEKTGKVDVVKFYIRRAFRIWPLYFFMLLTAPLMAYFFHEQNPGYGLYFFFAGNFDVIIQGVKSCSTDHLWSICVEEHFYLFCPLMIGFIPPKKLPQVLFSIVFASIVFRGFILLYSANYGAQIYLNTLSRIDVLALGSFFGYLVYHRKIQFNHPLWIRLLVYSTFIFIFFNVDYVGCGTFFSATIQKYFFVLCVAYWIGNFMFNPKAKLAIKKPNIFHQFGKISYGLYMFNPVIIAIVLIFFSRYSLHNFFLFLVITQVLIWLVCYLSYRFFELPFLALKEKYAVIKSGAKLDVEEPKPDIEIIKAEPVLLPVPIRD